MSCMRATSWATQRTSAWSCLPPGMSPVGEQKLSGDSWWGNPKTRKGRGTSSLTLTQKPDTTLKNSRTKIRVLEPLPKAQHCDKQSLCHFWGLHWGCFLTSFPQRIPQVSTPRTVLASASCRNFWHSSLGTMTWRRTSTPASVGRRAAQSGMLQKWSLRAGSEGMKLGKSTPNGEISGKIKSPFSSRLRETVTVTLDKGQAPPLSEQGKGDGEGEDPLAGGSKGTFC